MKKSYHIITNEAKQAEVSAEELAQFLSHNGQLLLPLVGLVEQCRFAVDEVVDSHGPGNGASDLSMDLRFRPFSPDLMGPRRDRWGSFPEQRNERSSPRCFWRARQSARELAMC